MKKNLFLLMSCLCLFLLSQTALATVLVKKSENSMLTSTVQQKQLKKQFAQEKKVARAERFLAHHAVDFNDPVQKWLWYGLVGIGASIVLGILSISWLAGIAGLLGVICLVIWLVKQAR